MDDVDLRDWHGIWKMHQTKILKFEKLFEMPSMHFVVTNPPLFLCDHHAIYTGLLFETPGGVGGPPPTRPSAGPPPPTHLSQGPSEGISQKFMSLRRNPYPGLWLGSPLQGSSKLNRSPICTNEMTRNMTKKQLIEERCKISVNSASEPNYDAQASA